LPPRDGQRSSDYFAIIFPPYSIRPQMFQRLSHRRLSHAAQHRAVCASPRRAGAFHDGRFIMSGRRQITEADKRSQSRRT